MIVRWLYLGLDPLSPISILQSIPALIIHSVNRRDVGYHYCLTVPSQ